MTFLLMIGLLLSFNSVHMFDVIVICISLNFTLDLLYFCWRFVVSSEQLGRNWGWLGDGIVSLSWWSCDLVTLSWWSCDLVSLSCWSCDSTGLMDLSVPFQMFDKPNLRPPALFIDGLSTRSKMASFTPLSNHLDSLSRILTLLVENVCPDSSRCRNTADSIPDELGLLCWPILLCNGCEVSPTYDSVQSSASHVIP